MSTIISTFGEEPEAVIQGIRQHACDRLILITEKELRSEKARQGLKRIEALCRAMDISVERCRMDPYDLMNNIEIIKKIISENQGVILNVTGGRKTISLAAVLAGFVASPGKIVYITEEEGQVLEIPRFTIYEKLLRKEKRMLLRLIGGSTTLEELRKRLRGKGMASNPFAVGKHLRELAELGLITVDKTRKPFAYSITPSGRLLR